MSIQLPEGTVVVEGVGGSIMACVYYPYRKSPDAYIVPNDRDTLHCLQCGEDIAKDVEAWTAHIRRHDRRKRVQKLAEAAR